MIHFLLGFDPIFQGELISQNSPLNLHESPVKALVGAIHEEIWPTYMISPS